VKKIKSKRVGRKSLVSLAACGTVGLGLTHGASAATLITFGGFTVSNVSIGGLPDYGDNVTADSADYTVSSGLTGVIGTPDITLDWFGQWDTYIEWDGRGNVAQSDFNGGGLVSILFTPSATSAVRLVSFVLDEWAVGGEGSILWDVSGSTGQMLASGLWTMTNAGGRSVLAPNVIGAVGDPLTLNLTLASGAPSYFALDNLTFDQVPEPGALALASAVAFGATSMRRRRRA
jgi:hypothetical protein